jgi:hypothetical protein
MPWWSELLQALTWVALGAGIYRWGYRTGRRHCRDQHAPTGGDET